MCARNSKPSKQSIASIGDVRGLGLFFAVEIGEEPQDEAALQHHARQGGRQAAGRRSDRRQDDGARASSSQAWVSHFVIAPPLIVTKEELDLGIAALDRHLGIADALVE